MATDTDRDTCAVARLASPFEHVPTTQSVSDGASTHTQYLPDSRSLRVSEPALYAAPVPFNLIPAASAVEAEYWHGHPEGTFQPTATGDSGNSNIFDLV